MFLLDNRIIQLNTPFEHNGTSYPSNWIAFATPEERAAIGITEIPEYPRPDDRFYIVTQNADWTWTTTPKDLSQLKSQWNDIILHQAYGLLLPSDWMIVRQAETQVAVPAAWLTYRSAVRTKAKAVIAAITAAVDVEALIVAVSGVEWPVDPNSQNSK